MRHSFKMPLVLSVLALTMVFADSALARGRYLHPGLGRFMQRDPNGMENLMISTSPRELRGFIQRDRIQPQKQYSDGMSLYQYVKSKPVTSVDPNGLASINNPEGLLGPSGQIACALRVYLENRGTPRPDGWNGSADTWSHCYVGCMIATNCGISTSVIANYFKEFKDSIDDQADAEFKDMVNSGVGTLCGGLLATNPGHFFMPNFLNKLSCKNCCKCANWTGLTRSQ